MRLKLGALREHLRASLWFIPAVCVLLSVALAAVSLHVDHRRTGGGFLSFTGSAESAQAVLSAIAGSIVTLTALVFSITIVVLQLASSQYSPRVLRSFLRDRRSQVVLGAFLATFAYTMLVLRAVRADDDGGGFVPQISVNLAYGLTGVSLFLFVFYIHHIAQAMQASSIVAEVADESRSALLRLYPSAGEQVDEPVEELVADDAATSVRSSRSGYLQAVDEDRLIEFADGCQVRVRLVPQVGDFVPEGSCLFKVHGSLEEDRREHLRGCVTLGRQRTMQQDPMFGFRQLVDIAEKALSPGINDPTTAVEALNRVHQLLLVVVGRQLPSPQRRGTDGSVRLELPRPSWDDIVGLAFDEIRQYGEGSQQVTRRLVAIVEDLLDVAPPGRRAVLEEQLERLRSGAERSFPEPADVRSAVQPSSHG